MAISRSVGSAGFLIEVGPKIAWSADDCSFIIIDQICGMCNTELISINPGINVYIQ